jgi:hypothetical protein
MGGQVHRDPVGLELGDELVGDLLPDPLLHREALREEVYEPGQFRDADDVLVGDVADVGAPGERQGVVLAQGEEVDRTLDNLAQAAVGPVPGESRIE